MSKKLADLIYNTNNVGLTLPYFNNKSNLINPPNQIKELRIISSLRDKIGGIDVLCPKMLKNILVFI